MADAGTGRTTREEPGATGAMGLVGDAVDHVTELFRKELDLFRAELQESVNKAAAGIGMMVAGIVLCLVALNVLAGAGVAWLAENDVSPGWAALIVFGVLAVIALILFVAGRSNLRAASLAPTRTVRSVRRDANMLKEATNNG